MPRSKDVVRQRLEAAALDLFVERGFDTTTAAQIARRAGVTERTFFHHFADKREALFAGEERLGGLLVSAIEAAPVHLEPLDVLCLAFTSLSPTMVERRTFVQARHALVQATPALHEREIAKLAGFAHTMGGLLRERGVPSQLAYLAAHAATAAFKVAADDWFDAPVGDDLPRRIIAAFENLRLLCAPR